MNKRIGTAVCVALALCAALAACNTVQGFGKDISKAGSELEQAAKKK